MLAERFVELVEKQFQECFIERVVEENDVLVGLDRSFYCIRRYNADLRGAAVRTFEGGDVALGNRRQRR
ncbi:hypothetical protein [Hyphomicrobium sp. NDB2Meth4]|uniref:hypothetical protein n=1 Tax=Hyphomicrobium sp. NDB2Meth4 TaxID=1892846 RepID=UPI000B2E3DBA|nr:hypothetical protein [Hyphomicrobium sp. NDB2Meth4]